MPGLPNLLYVCFLFQGAFRHQCNTKALMVLLLLVLCFSESILATMMPCCNWNFLNGLGASSTAILQKVGSSWNMPIHLHRWEQTNHLWFWIFERWNVKDVKGNFWLFGFGGRNPFRIPSTKIRISGSQNCGFLRICTSMLGVMSVISIASQVFWLRQSRMAVRGGYQTQKGSLLWYILQFWFASSFWQICGTLGTIMSVDSVDSSSPNFFWHVQLIYFESFPQNSSPGSIYLLWRCLGNLKSISWIHSVTQSLSIFRLEELPPRNSIPSPRAVVVVYKWLVAVRDKVLLGSFSQSRKVQQLQSGILFIQTLTCVWLWNILDSACRPATRRGPPGDCESCYVCTSTLRYMYIIW